MHIWPALHAWSWEDIIREWVSLADDGVKVVWGERMAVLKVHECQEKFTDPASVPLGWYEKSKDTRPQMPTPQTGNETLLGELLRDNDG